MGLFSSKSKSSSTTYNESKQSSGTIGDLSSDNLITGGDLYMEGLSGQNLSNILENNQTTLTSALDSNEDLIGQSLKSFQTLTETAINSTGKAYSDAYSGSQNESSRFFDSLRPFAVIAGAVLIFYFWSNK